MTQNDPIKRPIRIPGSMSFAAGATFTILLFLFAFVVAIVYLLPEAAIDVKYDQYMYNNTGVNLTLSLVKDFSAPTLVSATVHSVRRVARPQFRVAEIFLIISVIRSVFSRVCLCCLRKRRKT